MRLPIENVFVRVTYKKVLLVSISAIVIGSVFGAFLLPNIIRMVMKMVWLKCQNYFSVFNQY